MNFYSRDCEIQVNSDSSSTISESSCLSSVKYRISIFLVSNIEKNFHWLLRIHRVNRPNEFYLQEFRDDLFMKKHKNLRKSSQEIYDLFRLILNSEAEEIHYKKNLEKFKFSLFGDDNHSGIIFRIESNGELLNIPVFAKGSEPVLEKSSYNLKESLRPNNRNLQSNNNSKCCCSLQSFFFSQQSVIDKLVETTTFHHQLLEKNQRKIEKLSDDFAKSIEEIEFLKTYCSKLKEVSKRHHAIIKNRKHMFSNGEKRIIEKKLSNSGTKRMTNEVSELMKENSNSIILNFTQKIVLQAFCGTKRNWRGIYQRNYDTTISDSKNQFDLFLEKTRNKKNLLFILESQNSSIFGCFVSNVLQNFENNSGYLEDSEISNIEYQENLEEYVDYEEDEDDEDDEHEYFENENSQIPTKKMYSSYDENSFLFTIKNPNQISLKLTPNSEKRGEENVCFTNYDEAEESVDGQACFGRKDLKFGITLGKGETFVGDYFECMNSTSDVLCGNHSFQLRKLEVFRVL